MKKKLSVTKVADLSKYIQSKVMRSVNSKSALVYTLPQIYKTHIFDEYVTILGIKQNGEVITNPKIKIKPFINTLPIYDLAEIDDIINPI